MRRIVIAAAVVAASLLGCAQARADVHAGVQVYAEAGEIGVGPSAGTIDQTADDAGSNGAASASWGWPLAPFPSTASTACAASGCSDRSGGALASVDEPKGILRAGAGASLLVGNAPDLNFGGDADVRASASIDDMLTLSKEATVVLEGTVHGTLAGLNGNPDQLNDPRVETDVSIEFCCQRSYEGFGPIGGYDNEFTPDTNDGSPTPIDDSFSIPVALPAGTTELRADLSQTVSLLVDGMPGMVLAQNGLSDFTGTVTFDVVVPGDVVATSSSGLLPIVGGAPAGPSDTTAPTSSASVVPAADANGWNDGPVTVHIAASDEDGGSGVASLTIASTGAQPAAAATTDGASLDVPITAEGTTTLTYYAIDAAGNAEAPQTVTVRIDETAPAVDYSGNAGTYTVDQQVAITCDATDALSGVVSSTCADVSAPAYTFGVGPHTLDGAAVDAAGNTGTGSTSFTVTVDPASLAALTGDFVHESAAYGRLSPKQQAVVDRLVAVAARLAGHPRAYEAALAHLVRGGWLTTDQAQTLTGLSASL